MTTNLAVLGSPITHSKSPALHAAAYRELGLDWAYTAIEVTGADLREFVTSRDASWRGLSLTMPLKREVLPLLTDVDELVELTGGANTVLLDDGLRGFNTDVYGITEAFRANGVASLGRVQILGGGATAASALAAVAALGATHAQFALRDPQKSAVLDRLGASLGIEVEVRGFGVVGDMPDAVISTLPGRTDHDQTFAPELRGHAVLFDVAYDPWPSALAAQWSEVGGRVISGLQMLTLQALAQVRIFVGGSANAELENEPAVLAAMQRAVTP